MNTVPMDNNILNGLFDNQKKLDDLFDSIFDDDNYLISSSPSPSQSTSRYTTEVENQFSYGGNFNESNSAMKLNPVYYMLPIVLEVAVIYLVVTKLL